MEKKFKNVVSNMSPNEEISGWDRDELIGEISGTYRAAKKDHKAPQWSWWQLTVIGIPDIF